jgi:hypothetical protein
MSEMELRGIPTVFVATVEFTDGADRQSEALGVDLARVFVEHPIQDRTDEEMLDIANRAFDELVEKLVA